MTSHSLHLAQIAYIRNILNEECFHACCSKTLYNLIHIRQNLTLPSFYDVSYGKFYSNADHSWRPFVISARHIPCLR